MLDAEMWVQLGPARRKHRGVPDLLEDRSVLGPWFAPRSRMTPGTFGRVSGGEGGAPLGRACKPQDRKAN